MLPSCTEEPPKAPWLLHLEAMTYPDREDPRVAGLLGQSPVMRRARSFLGREVDRDAPVFLVGEHGTGKRHAARLLHEQGPRRSGPFNVLSADSPSVSKNLFGAGERPGALERGGTLVIMNAHALTLDLETRLFTAITDRRGQRLGARTPRPADVPRLVFASHHASTTFDEPRLAGIMTRIDLWPLRDRREDIPLLVEHLMRHERTPEGQPLRLRQAVLEFFARHPWPGNVEELARTTRQLMDRYHACIREKAARAGAELAELAALAADPPSPPEEPPVIPARLPVPEPPVLAEPPVAWRSLPAPPPRLRPPRFTRDGVEAALSAAVVFTAAMLIWIHAVGP